MTKPMSAYIAGVTAPGRQEDGPRRRHRLAAARARPRARWTRSRAAGVQVGLNPTEAGELMAEIVAAL